MEGFASWIAANISSLLFSAGLFTFARMIAQNLQSILGQMAECAATAGRDPASVRLVAVTKTKPVSMIREVVDAGHLDLGENRVQEMLEKAPELPGVRWHLIGTLQRNKVKYIAPFVHLIHSVDSSELLAEISKQAGKNGRVQDCLLQVNISDEPQKGGLTEAEAEALLRRISDFPHVRIFGLMGMAEFTDDREVIRGQFRRLAGAQAAFQALNGPQIAMRELSMGMSGDFDIAIEEGATLVRIGSAVFGGR
jgi:pyridoxal phosphate enzyme (YggS family)